jgi:hypothetical protein
MLWLILLAVIVAVAIWLTFVLIKWLFIIAIVAVVVWFVFFRGRSHAG